jgi:hypothetical protein
MTNGLRFRRPFCLGNDVSNTPVWPQADFIAPVDGPGVPTGSDGAASCGLLMKITCNDATFSGFSFIGL